MTSPSQAHDPCLRNVGCIFTRNHTGHCSTFSPSSVPVPRPSEGEETPEAVWFCKVGGPASRLPLGADAPMRSAIKRAFRELTGRWPEFCFSGWGAALTEPQRAVVENREPAPSVPTATQEQRETEEVPPTGQVPWSIICPHCEKLVFIPDEELPPLSASTKNASRGAELLAEMLHSAGRETPGDRVFINVIAKKSDWYLMLDAVPYFGNASAKSAARVQGENA